MIVESHAPKGKDLHEKIAWMKLRAETERDELVLRLLERMLLKACTQIDMDFFEDWAEIEVREMQKIIDHKTRIL